MEMEKDGKNRKVRSSAASGAVAIIFLIIGFQAAVFVLKVLERPEGVTVQAESPPEAERGRSTLPAPDSCGTAFYRRAAVHRRQDLPGRKGTAGHEPGFRKREGRRRSVESFRFDPNTVSLEDLMRLGLSEKQAVCIDRYREKGGRFRRKEDFARMYVVSDSLYARLEDFIDIPRLELNTADSASLTGLKGIGPWYAAQIIKRRKALGGFYTPLQLMEIRGLDSSRYAGFSENVRVDTSLIVKIDIYRAPEESLALHPYIGRPAARAICRYREMSGVDSLSADVLLRENIIDDEIAERLKNYL